MEIRTIYWNDKYCPFDKYLEAKWKKQANSQKGVRDGN
jgi:hypothetical protein